MDAAMIGELIEQIGKAEDALQRIKGSAPTNSVSWDIANETLRELRK